MIDDKNKLTDQERQQLKYWLSTTPMQRLAWLEYAQRLAMKTGVSTRNGAAWVMEVGYGKGL